MYTLSRISMYLYLVTDLLPIIPAPLSKDLDTLGDITSWSDSR